jgi:group I intron endonuclease
MAKIDLDKPRITYLYRISLKEDPSKDYVGVTCRLSRRWVEHRSDSRNGRGKFFARALEKYGIDNFKWEVLAEYPCMRAAFQAERDVRASGMGHYNLTDGGEGALSPKEEVRRSRSKSLKQTFAENNVGDKISVSLKKFYSNNPEALEASRSRTLRLRENVELETARLANMRATMATPEYRQKRSEQAKVYLNNPVTHQRMSDGQKRRLSDPAQRQIRSDRLKKFCANPEWFDARQKKITEIKNTPENKAKVSSQSSSRWARVRELGLKNLTELKEYDRNNPTTK